ncbi:alpha/beta hydrolase [Streptomyces sp. NPDC047022]|uniref:alpha/beta hydrolase n=1 Tax=Streptomyces sp. NPDC047022 TaxID=3155737 RepID=UPI00340C6C3A
MNTEPTLVLVHGAWHGAWCWEALEPALRERGIAHRAVDLTSRGTDAATIGDLHSDVEFLRDVVQDIAGPVVLLGHSYGGMVITEAADGLDSVTQLIYLSAFLPDVGESMRVLTGGGNAPWINFNQGLLSVAPGWGSRLFYSDCDSAAAADAESRLVSQSAASFGQEISATAWRTIPSTYIVTTDDRSVPTPGQRTMSRRTREVVDFPGGHSPMISQPKRLADLLRERL